VLAASLALAEVGAGQVTFADDLAVHPDTVMVATSFDRVAGWGANFKSEMLSQRKLVWNE
jgi:hypothetical protein